VFGREKLLARDAVKTKTIVQLLRLPLASQRMLWKLIVEGRFRA